MWKQSTEPYDASCCTKQTAHTHTKKTVFPMRIFMWVNVLKSSKKETHQTSDRGYLEVGGKSSDLASGVGRNFSLNCDIESFYKENIFM